MYSFYQQVLLLGKFIEYWLLEGRNHDDIYTLYTCTVLNIAPPHKDKPFWRIYLEKIKFGEK